MRKYLHLFNTNSEYTEARENEYIEPWVSYTMENKEVDYNKSEYETPFTLNITSNGNISFKKNSSSAPTVTLQYKKNDEEWTSFASSDTARVINVAAGDKIMFKGDNTQYANGASSYNSFSGTTAGFTLEGNIMSLISSENFANLTTLEGVYTFAYFFRGCTGLTNASKLVLPATALTEYCYSGMFRACSSLTTAPELPATTLADYCYSNMFTNCTSLVTAPAELPATALTVGCYSNMFSSCSSLTTAPELPATTLASHCYDNMFSACTGLTSAPELPATALTEYCYSSMFSGCRSLTTAPELPATTLEINCYYGMFQGCTSLTTAPELPATTLTNSCYYAMFSYCTNLNSITCLATDISATYCTNGWLNNVSSTGTFTKATSMSSWPTGNSGIPNNWTVQDA